MSKSGFGFKPKPSGLKAPSSGLRAPSVIKAPVLKASSNIKPSTTKPSTTKQSTTKQSITKPSTTKPSTTAAPAPRPKALAAPKKPAPKTFSVADYAKKQAEKKAKAEAIRLDREARRGELQVQAAQRARDNHTKRAELGLGTSSSSSSSLSSSSLPSSSTAFSASTAPPSSSSSSAAISAADVRRISTLEADMGELRTQWDGSEMEADADSGLLGRLARGMESRRSELQAFRQELGVA